MIEAAQDSRLQAPIGRDLQDDQPSAQLLIAGQIDPGHPPRAQDGVDPEAPEAFARLWESAVRPDRRCHLAQQAVVA